MRRLAVALVVLALAILGCGSPAMSPSTAWSVASSVSMPPDLQAAVVSQSMAPSAGGQAYVVRTASVSGDWAIVSSVAVSPRSSASPPASGVPTTEMTVSIAHRVGGSWQVINERDMAAFCTALKDVPPTLLSAEEASYFTGCH